MSGSNSCDLEPPMNHLLQSIYYTFDLKESYSFVYFRVLSQYPKAFSHTFYSQNGSHSGDQRVSPYSRKCPSQNLINEVKPRKLFHLFVYANLFDCYSHSSEHDISLLKLTFDSKLVNLFGLN